MRFTFITNVKTDRPGERIADIMRQAAHVIERQLPLEHHHMYDVFGVQTCEWDIEEPQVDKRASRRS